MSGWIQKEEWFKYRKELIQETEKSRKELVDKIYECEENLILHSDYEQFIELMNRRAQLNFELDKLNEAQRIFFINGRYTPEQVREIYEERDRIFRESRSAQNSISKMDSALEDELGSSIRPSSIIEYEREVQKNGESGISRPEEEALSKVFQNEFRKSASDAERRVRKKYYG